MIKKWDFSPITYERERTLIFTEKSKIMLTMSTIF